MVKFEILNIKFTKNILNAKFDSIINAFRNIKYLKYET